MLERVDKPSEYRLVMNANGVQRVPNESIKPTVDKNFQNAMTDAERRLYKEEMKAQGMDVLLPEDMVPSDDALIANMLYDNTPLGRTMAIMIAKLGLMHQAKYCNGGNVSEKLADLNNIAQTADYTGMSDAEKFTAIYGRYAQAFGDFWRSRAISYQSIGTRSDGTKIMHQFNDELKTVFGSLDKAIKANRTAQYGDMSDSEVREEIASKYPPTDKITLREFHYMMWEMNSVGVDKGLSSVLRDSTFGYRVSDVSPYLVREELFDKPLDLQRLCNSYNAMVYGRSTSSEGGTVLRELFNVKFDTLGNAYPNSKSPINFEALIKQFEQTAKNWTEADYNKWLASHS